MFGAATDRYVTVCSFLMRRTIFCVLFLLLVMVASGWLGGKIPSGFVPIEDQGYLYANLTLPEAASLQRTVAVNTEVTDILLKTPGVQDVTSIAGFSLLSGVNTTYNGFFFVTLKPWKKRAAVEEQLRGMMANANEALTKISEGVAFVFPPPAIPGIGTSGGVTFLLEDRAGMDVSFLAQQTQKFMEAARKRPEIGRITTTLLAGVPQFYLDVDQDKVLKQGVQLSDVYKAVQVFMGGSFVNYFNRFGRTWQVYLQADGPFRRKPEDVGQFYVRNNAGDAVPLSALTRIERRFRTGIYDALQPPSMCPAERQWKGVLQLVSGDGGAGGCICQDHAEGNGLRLQGHVLPGTAGPERGATNRYFRIVTPLRLLDSSCPIRKLVSAVQRPPLHADRRIGRLCGVDRPTLRSRRLRP